MRNQAEIEQQHSVESSVTQLYRHRFPPEVIKSRLAVWRILCRSWFSRYIPQNARILEVAAGYCEFINNVEGAERVAIDVNPDIRKYAAAGVVVHQISAEHLDNVLSRDHFDVVFMSNFLEHCRSREQILRVLSAVANVLKPKGSILILGPNFRYSYQEYFDFFDHRLPLTEKAVVEALQLAGFQIKEVQPRTLPFSFKSRLPHWPWLVELYLRLPLFWRLFGRQFFIVGVKVID